jgi:hypothetical protein
MKSSAHLCEIRTGKTEKGNKAERKERETEEQIKRESV